jgi:hypothetical protein
MIGRPGPAARWRDLGASRTLAQLPAGAEAAASLDPRLATLLDQADGPVITTLETHLDLAGDAKASAERLSLHRVPEPGRGRRGRVTVQISTRLQLVTLRLRHVSSSLARPSAWSVHG